MREGVVTIVEGTPECVPFIVRCIMAAVDRYSFEPVMDEAQERLFDRLCRSVVRTDTLYSYRNALVAKLNGTPVGVLVSYPGDRYAAGSHLTIAAVLDGAKEAPETAPGEYYLDSMAIAPEARGLGIGLRLLRAGIDCGTKAGCDRVTLLVDGEKPRLEQYYTRAGFVREEAPIILLGRPHHRMCAVVQK